MDTARRLMKEQFIPFFARPSLESLPDLLKNTIGEMSYIDFKENWPAKHDVNRHILGMSNSGGGLIVIGVRENEDKTLSAIGMSGPFKDKAVFQQDMESNLRGSLTKLVTLGDFDYTASANPAEVVGKRFQAVFIDDDPEQLPHMAIRGTTGIEAHEIYVRRGASTKPANYDDIQALLNRRIETNHSTRGELDLQSHLDQLNVLYQQIPRFVRSEGGFASIAAGIISMNEAVYGRHVDNPEYPEQSYQEFIRDVIERKKKRIEQELDLSDSQHG